MLRLAQLAVLVAMLVPVAGSRISARTPGGEASPEYYRLFDKLRKHLERREYTQARPLAQQCIQMAAKHKWRRAGNRALGTLAGIEVWSFHYQKAISHYLTAWRMAEEIGDWDMVVLHSFNLSNVYFHLGALDEAQDALLRAETLQPLGGKIPSPANLKMHKARLHARRHSARDAMPLFRDAALAADERSAPILRAQVWDLAAVSFWREGNVEEALALATEAFRVRKLSADPYLSSSFLLLSRLQFDKGRFEEARLLAERAMEAAKKSAPRFPVYSFFLARGLARHKTGDLEGAREDLEAAVTSVRSVRLGLGASDALRSSAGVEHAAVFSALADLYFDLYRESGDESFLRKGFTIAAEGRAYSLKEAAGETQQIRDRLPLEFYATLDAYRHAEMEALGSGSRSNPVRLASLRRRLAEIEVQAGGSRPEPKQSSSRLPEVNADEAILQFQLGNHRSLLWVLTSEGVAASVLPPSGSIEKGIEEFVRMLKAEHRDQAEPDLYRLLFSGLPLHALRKRVWKIVPDDALFQLPFAALQSGRGRYLIEERAIRIATYPSPAADSPSAANSPIPRNGDGGFVAIADPIYNPADPRYERTRWAWRQAKAGEGWLPRLPGTAREAAQISSLWPADRRKVITGLRASFDELSAAVASKPEVLHLATHLVPAPGNPQQSRMVLSLGTGGRMELLNPETIASLPVRSRLVVMSGCRAGAATPVRGEGMVGMARAWLVAGAGSVVATLWPTTDDSGDLMQSFYRNWRNNSQLSEEEALRLAQLEMIRSESWRSRPRYWASFYVLRKS